MVWIIRLLKCLFGLILAVFALILVSNLWIVKSTSERVFFDAKTLPDNYDVALVLGTSPLLTNGLHNPFFDYRMKTASTLYKTGKIARLIVSGDNSTKHYNEPSEMRNRLLKLGVPDSAIIVDYAGLRTLDSIVRGKEIFGENTFIVITQAFHSYRALFIADYYGINTVALVASDPFYNKAQLVHWREYLARTKSVLDLYLLKTRPRYMAQAIF